MALRIEKLTLTDFRAFPGPAPAEFVFGGKNVLIYGENGSGKSSLFHALKGLFSYESPPDLLTLSNTFSDTSIGNVAVEVGFNNQTTAAWKIGNVSRTTRPSQVFGPNAEGIHPIHNIPKNTDVTQAAKWSAALDYRSLLATNYKHGDNEINLFDLAINSLLADYLDLASNKTLRQLWDEVINSKPSKNTARLTQECLAKCSAFNNGLDRALAVLIAQIQILLPLLNADGVSLNSFVYDNKVAYNFASKAANKAFNNQKIGLEIAFRGVAVERPQNYLNEARLSALGLAIFFGARLACVPTAGNALKLLVLDDVLVGLDHSNRIPVLDVLTQHFADWQIVLLTHDRNWYELAQTRLPSEHWTCYELYEADKGGVSAPPTALPVIRATELRPPKVLLNKAVDLLMQGYPEAAANYTRQACEFGLRAACEVKAIHMPYKRNPKDHQMQDLLDALKTWPIKKTRATKAEWDGALSQLEQYKNIVLNPYSHPSAPNIPSSDIRNAIDAVNHFLVVVSK